MRSFQGLRPTRSSAFGSCWTLSFLGQKQKSKRLTKVFVLAKRTKHALGRARWPRLRRKVQAEVDRIGENHSLRNLRVPYRDPSLLAFCEKSTGNSLSLGDETLLHARSVDDQTDHVMHADAGSFNDRFSLANARKFDQLTASGEDVNATCTVGLVCWACVLAQNTQNSASRNAVKLYRKE